MKKQFAVRRRQSPASRSFRIAAYVLSAFICVYLSFPVALNAQKRDSLTEFEADLIREAQEIDARMVVFVKVIERRFMLLENPNATQTEKEEERFGELPKGTKAQLLRDIERLLDESINNIDETATRDLKNKLLPKAMKTLVQGCQRFIPKLKAVDDKTTEKLEKTLVFNSIEYCNEIIEAQTKVPEPEPPKKKT
jgi:hypothetical protein